MGKVCYDIVSRSQHWRKYWTSMWGKLTVLIFSKIRVVPCPFNTPIMTKNTSVFIIVPTVMQSMNHFVNVFRTLNLFRNLLCEAYHRSPLTFSFSWPHFSTSSDRWLCGGRGYAGNFRSSSCCQCQLRGAVMRVSVTKRSNWTTSKAGLWLTWNHDVDYWSVSRWTCSLGLLSCSCPWNWTVGQVFTFCWWASRHCAKKFESAERPAAWMLAFAIGESISYNESQMNESWNNIQ